MDHWTNCNIFSLVKDFLSVRTMMSLWDEFSRKKDHQLLLPLLHTFSRTLIDFLLFSLAPSLYCLTFSYILLSSLVTTCLTINHLTVCKLYFWRNWEQRNNSKIRTIFQKEVREKSHNLNQKKKMWKMQGKKIAKMIKYKSHEKKSLKNESKFENIYFHLFDKK